MEYIKQVSFPANGFLMGIVPYSTVEIDCGNPRTASSFSSGKSVSSSRQVEFASSVKRNIASYGLSRTLS